MSREAHGRRAQPSMAPLRTRIIVGLGLTALPTLIWAPGLVAMRYHDGSASEALARPDRGWRFLGDAVRESRGARLGWHDAALDRAREVWASGPRATDVELRWGPRDYVVPIPPGGATPPARRRAARLRSRLNWVVTGRLPGRPEQIIGMLDYRSGAVVWNIRPLRGLR